MPGVIMLDANDNQGWVAKIKAADCHLYRRKRRWALEKIKSPLPITAFYREPSLLKPFHGHRLSRLLK